MKAAVISTFVFLLAILIAFIIFIHWSAQQKEAELAAGYAASIETIQREEESRITTTITIVDQAPPSPVEKIVKFANDEDVKLILIALKKDQALDYIKDPVHLRYEAIKAIVEEEDPELRNKVEAILSEAETRSAS